MMWLLQLSPEVIDTDRNLALHEAKLDIIPFNDGVLLPANKFFSPNELCCYFQ